MSVETLCPPYEDLPNQLKTAEGLQERSIQALFGNPIDAVKAPSLDQIIAKPEIGPIKILNPQVIEIKTFSRNPKITSLSEFKERKEREQIITSPMSSVPATETPDKKAPQENAEFIPGFSVSQEARSVIRIYNETKASGKTHQEAFEKAWKDHEGNLVRYHFEYTMRFPVLVNPVALNEQGHFVNSDSGRRLADMTSAGERNGAVKQSVIKTEKLLKDAKVGEIVVAPSSEGGTGTFINGKELVYKETELFFYEKVSDREVRAFTFIADLSYEQTLQLCKYFINPDPRLSDVSLPKQQRVEQMTANPFLIPAGVTSAHKFLDTVQEVIGKDVMRKANGANKTFREAHELIDLEDDLKLLPQRVQASREVYKEFLRKAIVWGGDVATIDSIEQKMGISLLEDIKIIEGKVEKDSPQVSTSYRDVMNSAQKIDRSYIQQNYAEQVHFMRTRMVGLGCNNPAESADSEIFGQSLSEIISGYSSGIGRGAGEASSLAPKCIKCRKELCEGKCFNCEKKASRAA